ncbi:hypothetical protein J3Q64DRAFT_1778060 [Phycomyces blakesleeanus]
MESFSEIHYMEQHFNEPTVLDAQDATEEIPSLRRSRLSSSSDDSSGDSFSENDDSNDERDTIIPTTFANLSNRRQVLFSSESESESDTHVVNRSRVSLPVPSSYMYMPKRQIEEAVLESITHQLHADKLPGILTILSSHTASTTSDEVEIDLSCLPRDQLVRVLIYVEACIAEQNGGPPVNIADYIKEELHQHNVSDDGSDEEEALHQAYRTPKKSIRRKRPGLSGVSRDNSNTNDHSFGPSDGPISMARLSQQSDLPKRKRTPRKKVTQSCKRENDQKQRKNGDALVSSPCVIQDPNCIASTKPKRRVALHKRRLLEDMLLPSDEESINEYEDNGDIVVFSDEKMDFHVTGNQTITHHSLAPSTVPCNIVPPVIEEDADDVEEIDIMV